MKTATFEGDATIDVLAARVLSDAGMRDPTLKAQLIDLNPHLANLDTLPPGTPILLPDTLAEGAGDPDVQKAVAKVLEALDDAAAQRAQIFSDRETAIAGSLQLARSGDLISTIKGDAVLEGNLGAITTDLDNQLKAVANDRKSFAKDLADAKTAISGPTGRRRAANPPG